MHKHFRKDEISDQCKHVNDKSDINQIWIDVYIVVRRKNKSNFIFGFGKIEIAQDTKTLTWFTVHNSRFV